MNACTHLPSNCTYKMHSCSTNQQMHTHTCLQCTHKHMHALIQRGVSLLHAEVAVNGAMVFGSSWNCKWILLRFQLIVLRNFGHGSLFTVIAAGEVWFINASLIAAAPIPVGANAVVTRPRHQNMMFVVVWFCRLPLLLSVSTKLSLFILVWQSWVAIWDRHLYEKCSPKRMKAVFPPYIWPHECITPAFALKG